MIRSEGGLPWAWEAGGVCLFSLQRLLALSQWETQNTEITWYSWLFFHGIGGLFSWHVRYSEGLLCLLSFNIPPLAVLRTPTTASMALLRIAQYCAYDTNTSKVTPTGCLVHCPGICSAHAFTIHHATNIKGLDTQYAAVIRRLGWAKWNLKSEKATAFLMINIMDHPIVRHHSSASLLQNILQSSVWRMALNFIQGWWQCGDNCQFHKSRKQAPLIPSCHNRNSLLYKLVSYE